ncbi:hypothetical protein [Kordia jejudonensis]|uniref:hypothetical protein n=1 Tax=Kordia jejudonensis TaxID=1348245 RepID=UPI0006291EB1|nr:hypothetical protein [Kordia jejudonensis]
MKEIEEELKKLKNLYDDGFLKDDDLIKKLSEIIKRGEKLKKSIKKQEDTNLEFVTNNFTVEDLLLLINFSD